MTLHTLQGQSAGPVDAGQPSNAVDRVIVDPGTRTFEGNNPGTLYMALSRATTMGSGNLDSAVYFTGPNLNRGRIIDIKYRQSLSSQDRKEKYKKVELRDKWVSWLDESTVKPKYTTDELDRLTNWCQNFTMPHEELDCALGRKEWRVNMRKGINY